MVNANKTMEEQLRAATIENYYLKEENRQLRAVVQLVRMHVLYTLDSLQKTIDGVH